MPQDMNDEDLVSFGKASNDKNKGAPLDPIPENKNMNKSQDINQGNELDKSGNISLNKSAKFDNDLKYAE